MQGLPKWHCGLWHKNDTYIPLFLSIFFFTSFTMQIIRLMKIIGHSIFLFYVYDVDDLNGLWMDESEGTIFFNSLKEQDIIVK